VDWFTVAGGMGSMDLVNAALVVVVPHLNPFPGPNSVLVLDNNATHRNPLLQIIRRTGALVAHTPPYTPQYNPIESAFNVAKAWLRRNRALVDAPGVTPFQAMDWALRSITFSTAMGFIRGTRVYTWDEPPVCPAAQQVVEREQARERQRRRQMIQLLLAAAAEALDF
jgi:hypothetical protein